VEGAPFELCRRCGDRRRIQYRGGIGLRELRRRGKEPLDDRKPCAHRLGQYVRSSRDRRGWRILRGGHRDTRRRAGRCAGDQCRAATEHRRLGAAKTTRDGGRPGKPCGRRIGRGEPILTGIVTNNSKRMVFVSGRAHPDLASQVSESLGTAVAPLDAYEFANGEIYVRFGESVRGADVFVLQSHTSPINEWMMEQLLMIDALKRASAKRITVISPFFPYARQDKKHRGREPISARLMADLDKTAGADRLMLVDLHTAQIQGFFDGPVDHLMALPILADYVNKKYADERLAVVSPDAGRIKVAEQWSASLGGSPLAFI